MMPRIDDAKERDDWLVRLGWGLFLLGTGTVWLLDNMLNRNLDGLIWMWGGVLLLALNGVRYLVNLKMSRFTLGLGVVLVVIGISDMVGLKISLFAVVLIVIGAAMLLTAWLGPRRFKERDTDYALDEPTHLTNTRP